MFCAEQVVLTRLFLLVTVSFGFLLLNSASAQVQICGHESYDLDTLKRKQFWAARVPNTSQCAGTDPTVTLCSIKFSVCGPLPAFSCGFEKTAGFCQNIDHSGLVKQHETGKQTLILNETNDMSGFMFTYKNGSSVGNCNTTETIVSFQCDPNAQWDINYNIITPFLDFFINDVENECLYMMAVNYSGACVNQNSVPPQLDLCQLGDYDIETLSEPPMWVATLKQKDCYSPSPNPFSRCRFYFSFCKKLPHGQCFNSAFCQAGYVWAGINSVSFGAFNKDQKIYENEDRSGFTITSKDGTKTANCSDGLFSTLVFTCNHDAVWSFNPAHGLGEISQFITAGPTLNDCELIVHFKYSGACVNASEPTVTPTSLASGSLVPLGWIIGLIIIAIFLSMIALYFGIGIMIQAIRRKKGRELIPNHDLWKALFINVARGCHFITCHKLKGPVNNLTYKYNVLQQHNTET